MVVSGYSGQIQNLTDLKTYKHIKTNIYGDIHS